jgi:hypothetical protein
MFSIRRVADQVLVPQIEGDFYLLSSTLLHAVSMLSQGNSAYLTNLSEPLPLGKIRIDSRQIQQLHFLFWSVQSSGLKSFRVSHQRRQIPQCTARQTIVQEMVTLLQVSVQSIPLGESLSLQCLPVLSLVAAFHCRLDCRPAQVA